MTNTLRKTKIICTLGPVSETPERLREMILAGANIFRLNMSHAQHDWVRQIVPTIRSIASELDIPVGILLDTQGPAVRTGDLPTKLDLKVGDIMEFTVRGARSEEVYSVNVNYDGLIDDINEGDVVLVDNGVIHLKVLSKINNRIRCEVLTPGALGSRRHINLPGVKVNLPPLTEKDMADVAVGAEVGVDFVALSFCREPSDIVEMRRVLALHGSNARVIAKIEDQSAVKLITEIIQETDAVMIARGDLGVECPMEELPIIQRKILKAALKIGKQVIVATHMLESMIENPVPTRAEVTDVANAVFEQADAIMLSGETTVGKYPVECVKVLDRIARRIERSGSAHFAEQTSLLNPRQKTAHSGVVLAGSFSNASLAILTRHGEMADYTSHIRPEHAPIYAITPSEETARHLTLNWGVLPLVMPFGNTPEESVKNAEELLLSRGLLKKGDQLIVMSDIIEGEEKFDSIQLRTI
ncbi:MAG: pyruvate kinase [Verrucomicrobia bacterium]|nr:pyruvate kinase [Verrucomicrobiota bacterium]